MKMLNKVLMIDCISNHINNYENNPNKKDLSEYESNMREIFKILDGIKVFGDRMYICSDHRVLILTAGSIQVVVIKDPEDKLKWNTIFPSNDIKSDNICLTRNMTNNPVIGYMHVISTDDTYAQRLNYNNEYEDAIKKNWNQYQFDTASENLKFDAYYLPTENMFHKKVIERYRFINGSAIILGGAALYIYDTPIGNIFHAPETTEAMDFINGPADLSYVKDGVLYYDKVRKRLPQPEGLFGDRSIVDYYDIIDSSKMKYKGHHVVGYEEINKYMITLQIIHKVLYEVNGYQIEIYSQTDNDLTMENEFDKEEKI